MDIFLFADDKNIYYENESFIELEKVFNKELKNLYLWLSANGPALNIMVATHPYSQNPAKNGYFEMAFQPLAGYKNGLISQWFPSHCSQRRIFTVKRI